MAFDLSKYRTKNTGIIQINDLDDAPIDGFTVEVYSPTSHEYQEAWYEMLSKISAAGKSSDNDSEKIKQLTRDAKNEFFAEITVRITGAALDESGEIGTDKAKIRAMYSDDAYSWVRAQVNAGAGTNSKRFLEIQPENSDKKSKKNS